MELTNQLILIGAAFLLGSIIASALSSRLGAPLLLVFLAIGMLAGEDGPGGIQFDDIQTAHLVGTLALAVILFDGGLRTRASSFRVGLWPALSLATVGVVVTAIITGVTAAWVFDLPWLYGLLFGAIVGSTDAAAVFSLLHVRGMEIKERVGATLEIESGTNDPMAVFLTIMLVELLAAGQDRFGWDVFGNFALQMGVGAAIGAVAGYGLAALINRLELVTGLYPLLALSGGLLLFGVTNVIGGSGFLAIYLAGLVLGNRRLHAAQNILRVHDGLAWLSQIVMFLVLGLLVTPSLIMQQSGTALIVAAVLILIARPAAVWLSLLPFRFPWREQLFIAWVGLRGAVPIVLALFPLLAGLPHAGLFFDVAFFVVLVSLLVQGWTLAPVARVLRLEVPPHRGALQRVNVDVPELYDHEFVGFRLSAASPVSGLAAADPHLGDHGRLVAIIRDGRVHGSSDAGTLRAGDYVYLLAPGSAVEALTELFGPRAVPLRLRDQRFFGAFVFSGETKLSQLADFYGLDIVPDPEDRSIADHLSDAYRGRVVVGDRVRFGDVELVVREVVDGRVTKVGLVLEPDDYRE